jgi:WhiB family redox-sensing transcriptional regulator
MVMTKVRAADEDVAVAELAGAAAIAEIEAVEAAEAESSMSVWLMTPDAPELPTLADFVRRPAWMDRAECRGEGSHLFFPRNEGVSEEALAFCCRCPVRRQCLDHAMAHPGLRGCWGGTSERERIRLRRLVG